MLQKLHPYISNYVGWATVSDDVAAWVANASYGPNMHRGEFGANRF